LPAIRGDFHRRHTHSTMNPAFSTGLLIIGTQLNIKSKHVWRLASGLAELTGESPTSVVTNALRSEPRRRESARDVDDEVERMLAMGRDIRSHMTEPVSSGPGDMYDDDGFPR
jgi:antitoxin VapB